MKLTHKKVPVEFLAALPEGIKYVQKQGKDYLVIEELLCSEGHSLMVDSVRLHGESSIRLRAKIGAHEGDIYVAAFWGSHEKLYSFIPTDADRNTITEAFCPQCSTSLLIDFDCPHEGCDCNKAIEFHLPGGANKIIVCAKHGCPEHQLLIQDMPNEVAQLISEINFFGQHDDDMFGGI